ncbi:Coenzyme F420 hydrogenase/dehydrogenase, beta subunit C-terminal domain [Chloroflexota bacterium]
MGLARIEYSNNMEIGKTIEQVVKEGLCTGCGTCVSLCPQDAIEMVINKSKGIYVPQLDRERCNECGICLDVCPGHSVDFKGLNSEVFGREPEDIFLGNYLKCYIGHAIDYDIRYNSASGGLVTALLIFALEEGLIDGALVTRMSEENPLEPQPFIARTRKEIISAAKSKYCPVPVNVALKEILNEEGRFAIVGLPCHIHGVRKAELANKKLKERIALHMSIFCSHSPSFLATEYVLHRIGVRKEKVKGLDYRGEGWPGSMKVSLEEGEVSVLLPDYWAGGFGTCFRPQRCTMCCDKTSELADVSFGDAWLHELKNDEIGISVIISRSEIGESLLNAAESQERIELEGIDRGKMVLSQSTDFKKLVTPQIFFHGLFGKKAPIYNTELVRPNFMAYFRGLLACLQRGLGSRRYLWFLIPGLIWFAKKLRI